MLEAHQQIVHNITELSSHVVDQLEDLDRVAPVMETRFEPQLNDLTKLQLSLSPALHSSSSRVVLSDSSTTFSPLFGAAVAHSNSPATPVVLVAPDSIYLLHQLARLAWTYAIRSEFDGEIDQALLYYKHALSLFQQTFSDLPHDSQDSTSLNDERELHSFMEKIADAIGTLSQDASRRPHSRTTSFSERVESR